jgi:hypothetical protein
MEKLRPAERRDAVEGWAEKEGGEVSARHEP